MQRRVFPEMMLGRGNFILLVRLRTQFLTVSRFNRETGIVAILGGELDYVHIDIQFLLHTFKV